MLTIQHETPLSIRETATKKLSLDLTAPCARLILTMTNSPQKHLGLATPNPPHRPYPNLKSKPKPPHRPNPSSNPNPAHRQPNLKLKPKLPHRPYPSTDKWILAMGP